jgi:hypothetical protein
MKRKKKEIFLCMRIVEVNHTWFVESKSCSIVILEADTPMPSSRLGIAEASSLLSAITATVMVSMLLR